MKPIFPLFILALALLLMGCSSNLPLPLFSSPTPSASPLPTFTPTPLPSPTPTLTPTPKPVAHLDLGDQALFYGDYDRALQEYQQALTNAGDDATRALALTGIGRSQMLTGQSSVAVTTLKSLLERFPNSPILPQVHYFIGEAYRAQNNLPKAAESYAKYIELRPGVLDAYLHELRGDLLASSGDANGAIQAYTLAAQAPQLGAPTPIELKIGQMYAASGDYKSAVRQYLAVYAKTQNEYYKAQANTLAGQAYLNLDLPEQAYARYQDSVNHFVRPYDTYTGLVVLVNAGVKVDELQRGLIDYYAGQYGYAIEAFNRYISQTPVHDGTPHHFKALSLLALKQPQAAIAEWDILIQNYPRDPWWAAAWDEKASAQWYNLGQYREAADTLLEFVRRAPAAPEAPAYLFEAARILERNDRLGEAAPIWERVMSEYPNSDQGWRALFLAGISYYRMETLDAALNTFQRALLLAADAEEQSAADFWIAKTYQTQGKSDQAHTFWEQCADRDPTGYYSVRAAEILLGLPPFGGTIKFSLNVNWEAEQRLADGWMRITFNLDPAINFSGPGDLAKEPRFQRGLAFWEIGQYSLARQEFESLRGDLTHDAANTYRLIPSLVQMGFYRSAIFASRQVLTLAGMDNAASLGAPAYFNHIRFGFFFQDLVQPYAESEKLNPLLVFSLIRQESLFEGFASSGAGARGLMQIMPATGQELANTMHWPPNFTPQDLYRPLVNIRMGTRYLARQRDAFEGDLLAALAAYNGGPGNALAWREIAKKDPDLFMEIIRIKETRDYVQQIYEFNNLYRMIYEK